MILPDAWCSDSGVPRVLTDEEWQTVFSALLRFAVENPEEVKVDDYASPLETANILAVAERLGVSNELASIMLRAIYAVRNPDEARAIGSPYYTPYVPPTFTP